MGLRNIPLVAGEYYHIFNRGGNKQAIFFDDNDRDRFLKLLYLCNSFKKIDFRDDITRKKISAWDFERGSTLISIGYWVLMPNHFHLDIFIPESAEDRLPQKNPAVLFMQKLETAYVKYINAKYKRTGPLFEGRFKYIHTSEDIQAKHLPLYIHLNPLKLIEPDWKERGILNVDAAVVFLKRYKWSSYLDYTGCKRSESKIIDPIAFTHTLQSESDMEKEIIDWIRGRPASAGRP